jgi:hypothetical protein
MGERKVLNKYIPSDFDPALVPRGTKLSKKDGTVPVRMMLPFSVQCSTCNTFLYRGRKFNSKKEAMGGTEGKYLGIQRWRFYIKCTHCSRTVSFLTDPKNADYEMESGGTRNYEVYKDKEKTEESVALEKEEEEKADPMKALENRVLDSQREMADLDNLEEIRAMNRRHIQLQSSAGDGFDADVKALLNAREAQEEKAPAEDLNEHGITEEEEDLVKSIKFGSAAVGVKRLNEEDEKREEEKRKQYVEQIRKQRSDVEEKKKSEAKRSVPVIKVKRKKASVEARVAKKSKTDEKPAKVSPPPAGGGMADLLGGYGSDSNSD